MTAEGLVFKKQKHFKGNMKNSYLNVITIMLSLYFTRTETTESRKLDILSDSGCRWDGDILMDCSFTGKSDIPMAIPPTVTTVDLSYNSIRALSVSNMKNEDWTIKHLNLGNNRISELTFSSFMCFPSLETLNLSDNEILSISLDLRRHSSLLGKCQRNSFRNVLPSLKILTIQRNHLNATPGGLWKLKSLQNLDLSSNAISQIELMDFQNCLQLEKLYLQNNKIAKIHPDAFKDLNKLQIVNLSINAMTTILPMMFIALSLPHLDADLSNNQWQCDCTVSVFQNFISESWRKKWNSICNDSVNAPGVSFLSLEWLHLNCKMHMKDLISFKKVTVPHGTTALLECNSDQPWGGNETYWWTPYNRISENTQTPHLSLNQMKKLVINKAERSLEGFYVCFSTSGRKKHIIYEISVKQKFSPRRVRKAREILASNREAATSQDLTLAICLSVIITFLCAFCLGALARPYIDRLWQQRCQAKSSVSENAYSNEGFYDDIGITENPRPRPESKHQDFCSMSLYENSQSPDLYASVIDDAIPRGNREENDGHEHNKNRIVPVDRKRNENRLQNHHDTCSIGSEDMNVSYDDVISIQKKHVFGKATLKELSRDDSFHEDSRRASSPASSLQSELGSFQSHSLKSDLILSREKIFPVPQMPVHPKSHSFGDSGKDKAAHLPSDITGVQKGFSKETQMSSYLKPHSAQQQMFSRNNSGSQCRVKENKTTFSDDPRDINHPSLLPNRENDLDVHHSDQNPTPSSFTDHQKQELNTKSISDEDILTDNSDDSDEGSLFTLSSSGSEYDWNNIQEQPRGEEDHVARLSVKESCPSKGSSDGMGNIQLESPKDNADIQKTFDEGENEKKEHFENIISRTDINLYETDSSIYQISNSNKTGTQESPPNSRTSSPISVEIPGMFIYDHVLTLDPEPSEWYHSWEKLEEVPIVNSLSQQTPSMYPEVPSESENSEFKEMDTQIYKYDTYTEISDIVKKEIPPEINPEEKLNNSQQSLEGNDMELNVIDSNDLKKDFLRRSLDSGSKWITKEVQSDVPSDEHSFQSERDKEYFETSTKNQTPSLQQKLTNKDKNNLPRIQKDISDSHWRQYSEEDMLELDKSHSHFCTNEPQFQSSIDSSSGIPYSYEEQLYRDGNSDSQIDNKKEGN